MIRLITRCETLIKYQTRFNFAENFKENQNSEEQAQIQKEDQKNTEKGVKQLKETQEIPYTEAQNRLDKEEIQKIFSKYKLTYSELFLDEILKWKKKQ